MEINGRVCEGTTKTLHTHLASDRRVGGFPVDAERGVDAGLLGIGVAGFADGDDAPVFEGQARADQAVGAQDAAYGVPFAVVAGLFEFLADPVEQVVGEDAEEDVSVDALFELVVAGAQAEGELIAL